jgi:hypothetical protein
MAVAQSIETRARFIIDFLLLKRRDFLFIGFYPSD